MRGYAPEAGASATQAGSDIYSHHMVAVHVAVGQPGSAPPGAPSQPGSVPAGSASSHYLLSA